MYLGVLVSSEKSSLFTQCGAVSSSVGMAKATPGTRAPVVLTDVFNENWAPVSLGLL